MYYDFAGALGFLSTAVVSLYYPALRERFWNRTSGVGFPSIGSFAPRQLLATAALSMWSLRLGSFLGMVSYSLTAAKYDSMRCHYLTSVDREH